MKIDVIGIGVQKCATAWLYRILSDHPNISLAVPEGGDKDTRFFSYFYDRGFEWYERHFQGFDTDVVGEYSTSYIYDLNAPRRLADYAPDVKLIVSLRHPVERVFSNHKHEIILGRISGENLKIENALENNPMYLEQSLYYKHLSRWLKYFPQNQLLVVLVDDIESDAKGVVKKLYEFLEVDKEYIPQIVNQILHQTRIPKRAWIETSVYRMAQLAKAIGLGKCIHHLKNKGVKKLIDEVNTKETQTAFLPMQTETRVHLLDYFKEENNKLSELIGRDLSMWDV